MASRILLYDKPLLFISIGVLAMVIYSFYATVSSKSYETRNLEIQTQLSDIRSQSGDITSIKSFIASKENKLRSKKSAGIVSTLEQILKSVEIKAKAIKPLGKKKVNEFNEDIAELQLEGTDLNSIVNLIYKIDVYPSPLKIKSSSLRSSFEDPDKFILKLSVSLMSKS